MKCDIKILSMILYKICKTLLATNALKDRVSFIATRDKIAMNLLLNFGNKG